LIFGNYPATVDPKGRLKIPTAVRSYFEEAYGLDFFVTSIDSGQSVRVYPLPVWKGIAEKLASPPSFNKAKRKLLDQTAYLGQTVRVDSEGRILIPAKLREPAAMRGEVAVLAQINRLDVWNDERFREQLSANPLTDEDLEKLGELGI
jgi:MraZ protein